MSIGLVNTSQKEYSDFKQMIEKVIPFVDVDLIQLSEMDITLIMDQHYELLIIDGNESDLLSIDVCEFLRNETSLIETPIFILLNNVPEKTTVDMINQIGVSGFLLKPLNITDFLSKTFSLIKHSQIPEKNKSNADKIQGLKDKIEELEIDLKKCLDAEQQIIETREFYKDLFEKAPMGYQSLDINGNFIEVNKKWTDIFGVRKEDVIGKNFSKFLVPEYQDKFEDRFEKLKKLGYMHTEFKVFGPDKEILDIEFESKVVLNEPDLDFQTMGVLENITEIKRAQNQINISEEKYRSLVTNMPLGLAVYETIMGEDGKPYDYRLISVNPSYEKTTGLKAEERLGKTLREIFPESFYNRFKKYEVAALEGKDTYFEEYYPSIGRYLNISAYYTSSMQLALVMLDVTEKVELNHKLLLEKQRLSRVVESTADIIFEVDLNKRFVSVYGKGLEKIGHTSSDYQGKTVIDVFGEDGSARDIIYTKALNGENSSYQWSFKTQTGVIHFESNIASIYDELNQIIGAVGIARDVTEQKKNLDEIEHMGQHDYLTDLYNRRYYEAKLLELNQESNYPIAIMMIDLNGLKILNDAFGHYLGDQALNQVANVLTETISNKGVTSRIGGDEFAVIFTNTTADELHQYKVDVVQKVSQISLGNISLSVAVGYEILDTYHDNLNDLKKNAENFMYRHKITDGMSTRNNAIKAILETLTDKYEEEKIHSRKVSQFCVNLGQVMELDSDDLKELELAGMYHDIGKISIPDAILDKPARLTKEEFDIIKTHTEVGYNILKAADQYSDLAIHALYHHERWDGNGYPMGLKEEGIPLFSRIICICDSFEAMTADRPYKEKMTLNEACDEIIRCSGSQFDPKLAKLFVTEVLKKEWKK